MPLEEYLIDEKCLCIQRIYFHNYCLYALFLHVIRNTELFMLDYYCDHCAFSLKVI